MQGQPSASNYAKNEKLTLSYFLILSYLLRQKAILLKVG